VGTDGKRNLLVTTETPSTNPCKGAMIISRLTTVP